MRLLLKMFSEGLKGCLENEVCRSGVEEFQSVNLEEEKRVTLDYKGDGGASDAWSRCPMPNEERATGEMSCKMRLPPSFCH